MCVLFFPRGLLFFVPSAFRPSVFSLVSASSSSWAEYTSLARHTHYGESEDEESVSEVVISKDSGAWKKDALGGEREPPEFCNDGRPPQDNALRNVPRFHLSIFLPGSLSGVKSYYIMVCVLFCVAVPFPPRAFPFSVPLFGRGRRSSFFPLCRRVV